jgi:hypothetical protein
MVRGSYLFVCLLLLLTVLVGFLVGVGAFVRLGAWVHGL